MNKCVTAVSIAAGLAAAAPPASAAKIVFRGAMVVESASEACGVLPYIEQGALFATAYRPADLGSNGPSTTVLSLDGTVDAADYVVWRVVLEDGSLSGEYQPVNGLSLNFEEIKLKESSSRMRLLEQTPSTLTATSKFVFMRARIRDFGGAPECTLTFRAALTLDKSTPKL
jgi:hypothetical protein